MNNKIKSELKKQIMQILQDRNTKDEIKVEKMVDAIFDVVERMKRFDRAKVKIDNLVNNLMDCKDNCSRFGVLCDFCVRKERKDCFERKELIIL